MFGSIQYSAKSGGRNGHDSMTLMFLNKNEYLGSQKVNRE